MLPNKLEKKLKERQGLNALRHLGEQSNLIDFSSNDYLGFSKSEQIFNQSFGVLKSHDLVLNGSTGSRLLSGNHKLYELLEDKLTKIHNCESALVYNSGYDANIGFFSSVPLRGDIILYDAFIHASIRDGITMSNAKSYKFKHNDLKDLEGLLERHSRSTQLSENTIYVVTESVFSMDGDSPDLLRLSELAKNYQTLLIIDEAHAVGVFGENGSGLVQSLNLQHTIFARIITFGKALGCHGSAILCSESLKQYLINFSRSFIYTTALPPHSLATILCAYDQLENSEDFIKLHNNIQFFKSEIIKTNLNHLFIESDSSIHCCIIPGNKKVKDISSKLRDSGFDVKPIMSPTVPVNKERLRFCLHSFNSKEDIQTMLLFLSEYTK